MLHCNEVFNKYLFEKKYNVCYMYVADIATLFQKRFKWSIRDIIYLGISRTYTVCNVINIISIKTGLVVDQVTDLTQKFIG